MSHSITRYHDINVGHRVHGHEGKCQHLHGHNYRIHFDVIATDQGLDDVGRVLDFSAVKSQLCMWIENNWDHKFLAWEQDPLMTCIHECQIRWGTQKAAAQMLSSSVVWVPFNPTAENMAEYLVNVIGPQQLAGTGCVLVSCTIEETAKCSATYSLD